MKVTKGNGLFRKRTSTWFCPALSVRTARKKTAHYEARRLSTVKRALKWVFHNKSSQWPMTLKPSETLGNIRFLLKFSVCSFVKRLNLKSESRDFTTLSPPSERYVTRRSLFVMSLRSTESSCAHQPERGEKHTHTHLFRSTDPQEMLVTLTQKRSWDKCGVLWSQWAISAVFPLTS